MKYLQNLHTHSKYCDGKDTLEEMISYALEQGFESLGFSGHSPMLPDTRYAMTPSDTVVYKAEVASLKKKYADNIELYLGLEYDMYASVDLSGYDYLIGSLHYLSIGGEYIDFDRNADEVAGIIRKYFGGKGIAFAKAYYRALADMPRYGSFDLLGHIDIITKNCEKAALFDENSKEYLDAAFEAIDALAGKIPFFEVNTGAIARGYRTAPYPSPPILKELRRKGFGAVITSDCHDGRYLQCGFDMVERLLKECGFQEKFILTQSGFVPVSLS